MMSGGGLSELRQRLMFVLLALVVYRIGSHIPVPGINPERLRALFDANQGGILELLNMFSGGAIERMSILDRKSTRLNSSHSQQSRMPSSA